MAYLQLKPLVGFGLVGGRPIFLDLERDRYFGLAAPAAAVFERVRHENGEFPPDDPGMASLFATNLFLSASSPRPFAPACAVAPAPTRALAAWPGRPRVLDLAEAWMLLHTARRALRARKLAGIVAGLKAGSSDRSAACESGRPAELAGRFLAARALAPVAPSCLQDSLALARWLRRRSAFASLIFGVKLDPFAAHCWLQANDLVLNDAPDRIAEFTPVLVIS